MNTTLPVIFALLTFSLYQPAWSQSVDRQSISPFVLNSATVSSTMGELAVSTLTEGNLIITQGFEQGDLLADVPTGIHDISQSIMAYPNPAKNRFTIEVGGDINSSLNLEIIDLQGRHIQNTTDLFNQSMRYEVDLTEAPAGQYLLRLFSNDQQYQGILKVIKTE